VITELPVRRRLVGGALRRHRDILGYSLDEPARVLKCDRSKISRIETGQRGIALDELCDLLDHYGVEEQEQAVLAAVTGPRGRSGWWRPYAKVLPSTHQDYLAIEHVASQILLYEPQRVPELLQTRDYARALADANPELADDTARDLAADAVRVRQHALLDGPGPEIHVVIGEAALRQLVGGPAVMKAQLGALAMHAAGDGPVVLQVLPFDSGAHAAAAVGSLAILRFLSAPALGVVHLDGANGGTCLDSQEALAAHIRTFECVRAYALTPEASSRLLWELAAA
jgi:transcriptional regulator with XRE-family HTH domain